MVYMDGHATWMLATNILYTQEAGKEIWRHTYPCPLEPKSHEGGPSATPTVNAGKVYTLSKQGHVFCLGAQDGAVVWRKHLTDDFGVKHGPASRVIERGDRHAPGALA